MDRRRFLQAGVFTAGGTAAIPLLTTAAGAQSAGTSPYGSIEGIDPDENGIILPEGFTSRVVAVAGEPVGDTDFEWHIFPDGAATFAQDDGGWIHTVNSEVFVAGAGGVSAIRYDADGNIVDAYEVLRGSIANCGGGPTPWGTFLSGEEDFTTLLGVMWECDPTGATDPVALEAMGRFPHEAAAVDPVREHVYQTEDMPDGRLYRFTPVTYPDLTSGLLEVATVADDGAVTWSEVPDPSGAETAAREQVPESTAFLGGEGIWYFDDWIFFSTKFDNKIHGINVAEQTHTVLYEADPDDVAAETAVLSGVDNLTVDHGSGDIYVAEDGGNMEIVIITPDGEVAPFLRIAVPEVDESEVASEDAAPVVISEITGPVFNPTRDRLYFSSQRGPTPRTIVDINPLMDSTDRFGGITYEVTGPFRGVVEAPPETTTTTEAPPESTTTVAAETDTTTTPSPTTTLASVGGESADDDDDSNTGLIIGAGAGAAVLVAAGAIGLRRRGQA